MFFSAMAFMGACLGRSVRVEQDVRSLWPMLNVLFIGTSGIGKTTSLEIAMKLLPIVPKEFRPLLVAGKATPEKLHEDLAVKPHAILYAEELAAFFSKQKYMEGMIPYVTALLNYLPEIETRTRKDKLVVVKEPAVTVIGGSTPEWLQDQLPDSATTGGFLARFLIVYEQNKSQRVALPNMAMSRHMRDVLHQERAKVMHRYLELLEMARGLEIGFADYSTADVYSCWYNSHTPLTGHLAPFAARAGEFVQRLALLLAISRGKSEITSEDIHAAIQLQAYCEERLQQVIVPVSMKGRLLAHVLKAVGGGEMNITEICRAMRNYATSRETKELVDSLITDGGLCITDEHKYKRT